MKTDPDKEYHIRNMDVAIKGSNLDGWLAVRKNGNWFLKRFRKNCAIFFGGEKLDRVIEKNPEYKAIEVENEKTN